MIIRNDRPENRNGGRHFNNALEFKIALGRTIELKDFLKSIGLEFQHNCRFSFIKFSHKEAIANGYYDHSPKIVDSAIISFLDPQALILFKLSWTECVPDSFGFSKIISSFYFRQRITRIQP